MKKNKSQNILFSLLLLLSFFYNSIAWADVQALQVSDWQKISNKISNEYKYIDPVTQKEITFIDGKWGGETEGKGVLESCDSVGKNVIEASHCLLCPLFAVLYNAANQMSELSFDSMGKACSMVVLIGGALVLVFKTLKHVSSFTVKNAPEYIGDVLELSFKVLISYLLLTNSKQIYEFFITPVLSAGLEFGSAMLFNTPEAYSSCVANIEQLNTESDTALLPVSLFAKLDCFIRSIQNEIALTQAIGDSLMCVSRHEASTLGVWDFGMMIQGAVIWGFALMLSLAFAFYLIDATVTLGLVGALMPFLIASWPFKWTSGYTKTGVNMLLNTFFTYVFMGVVVSINMQLIGQALSGGNTTEAVASTESTQEESSEEKSETKTESEESSEAETSAGVKESNSGLNAILDAMNQDNVDSLSNMIDIGNGSFLVLLCCCIFGFKFTGTASELASKMAGGGISKIGSSIGGMAAGGAAQVGKTVTKPAREAAAKKFNQATNKAGNAIKNKLGLGKYGGGGKTPANGANNQGNGANNRGNGANNHGNGQNNQSNRQNNNPASAGNNGPASNGGNPLNGHDVAGELDEERNS